jgi:hypothetical protein
MPGTEAAYAGAIVKALKPRTVLIIGEHKGILTDYLLDQAPDDCLFFTCDLPQSMHSEEGYRAPDAINQSYVKHTDQDIGSTWRDKDDNRAERVFGFLGDSGHSNAEWLINALAERCDLVLVDGSHSRPAVQKDLLSAWQVLGDYGVVLIDDFNKLPRLKGVEYAVQETRDYFAELPFLYQVSWGVKGPLEVNSNLAIAIKASDPKLPARRKALASLLNQSALRQG